MLILRTTFYTEEELEDYEKRLAKKKRRKNIAKGVVGAATVTGGALLARKYYKNKYIPSITKPKETYNNVKANIGDIVSASRMGGFYSHYGVVTGYDKKGRPLVTNYTNPTSLDPRKSIVTVSSLKDFGNNGKITVHRNNGKFTPEEIVNRSKQAIKNQNGGYSITGNNCEHFARELANGEHVSTQVNEKLPFVGKFKEAKRRISPIVGKFKEVKRNISPILSSIKQFSVSSTQKEAPSMLKGQFQHIIANKGFDIRKNLSKDLGGLSHFNRYQDHYLTGGMALAGGMIGRARAKHDAKRKARSYRLREGTPEYENYVSRKANEGMLKGAAIGGTVGFGSSKATDAIRGKVIADKAKLSNGLDLGTNYLALGKSMRGIKSEDDIDRIKNNYKEVLSFGKGVINAL